MHSVAAIRNLQNDPPRARKVAEIRFAALRRDIGHDLSVGDDAEDYTALPAALFVYSDKRGERQRVAEIIPRAAASGNLV